MLGYVTAFVQRILDSRFGYLETKWSERAASDSVSQSAVQGSQSNRRIEHRPEIQTHKAS